MDPQLAASIVLVLCLVLVVAAYVLGVAVGRAAALRLRPPAGAARPSGR